MLDHNGNILKIGDYVTTFYKSGDNIYVCDGEIVEFQKVRYKLFSKEYVDRAVISINLYPGTIDRFEIVERKSDEIVKSTKLNK